ncbi:MAG: hypothetical protein ACTHOB_04810 [Ginsengibacter sp.]|jgi:hypothetical protein
MNKMTPLKTKRTVKKPLNFLDGILPFTEKPSNEHMIQKEDAKNDLGASDLFSLFTANIIKEEITFIR